MGKKILIRDVTLRDGQQSLFATRMTGAQIAKVLPFYKEAGFYAMEVWGGAVLDSAMRFLEENPWERLDMIAAGIEGTSQLTALSRGRNLFGYNPYPDEVIEGFCRNTIRSGINILRIFDALNDVENVRSTVRFVKENGGIADCAVCYTVNPPAHFLAEKSLFGEIFTTDYFLKTAKLMRAMGADIITIKDMAGLITPEKTAVLVKAFKKELDVPIDLHTHCTPGFGLASVMMAIVSGADIVDTAMLAFSGGPAAPAFELVHIFASKLGIETGVNLEAVANINRELGKIRKELAQFDECKENSPPPFDLSKDQLPDEIDRLFDKAANAASAGRCAEVLEVAHAIERHFNLPPPNEPVRLAQIPGGMYSNMVAQMKQLGLEHLMDRVLEMVPRVRVDAGCPPLVTPTSQIVGAQAVNCVLDESRNQPIYTTKSTNFVNLVKGSYGKTPVPIDPDFREKITGSRGEIPYDTSAYHRQENPILGGLGGVRLATNEREELLLELFPGVAQEFLRRAREREHRRKQPDPASLFDEWMQMHLYMH